MATDVMSESLPMLAEPVETALVRWLTDNLFEPARLYREKVVDDQSWRQLRELAGGNTWYGETEPEDYPPFSVNMVMATIDTVKGIALQSAPVVEFNPVEDDDAIFAMETSAIVSDYLWGARKARFKIGVAFSEGAIIGTAWAKTIWNAQLNGGEGDVDFIVLPTEEVYIDPSCTGINDWDFVVHAPRVPVLKVKYDKYLNDRKLEVKTDRAPNEGQKDDTSEDELDLVTRFEYWVKGPYLEALRAEVPEFASNIDADADKYGMVITVADNKVLKYNAHPWLSDRLPFHRYVYYAPTGNQRIYGSGEAVFLKDAQLALQARATQMLNQAALLANQQWVVSNMCVVDETELTNQPGAIIHVDGPPDGIKRLEPTGISSSIFSTISLLLRFFELVSGMYPVNRGETPGSIRAAIAIEALQRGGEGRTLQKAMNFDDFIIDLSLGMVDIMSVMYDEERKFRITGSAADDINAREAQMNGGIDPNTGMPMGAQVDPMTGQPMVDEMGQPVVAEAPPGASRTVALSKDKFAKDGKKVLLDARAQVGLMLRNSAEQLRSDMELMDGGVVDAQYVIENNPLRNKERLLTRLFQSAQMQQGQQGAMPPEGAVPPEEQPMVESAATPEEQAQMQQTIDMLIQRIRDLEAQGVVPPGTADQTQAAVDAEISGGGTGEIALSEALKQIQAASSGAPVEGAPVDGSGGVLPPSQPM